MSEEDLTTNDIIFRISMVIILTIITATSQGLLIAFLSIDPLEIELTMRLEDEALKSQAKKVFPILQKHYLLLVTLLYVYVACVVLFPTFLHKLVPPLFAILLSIILVLFFGEIVPGAICTGPNQIKIASKLVPLVKFLLFVFWPLAKPFAIFLEYCFKRDDSKKRFTIHEFKALIDIHTRKAMFFQTQYARQSMSKSSGNKLKSWIKKLIPYNLENIRNQNTNETSQVESTRTEPPSAHLDPKKSECEPLLQAQTDIILQSLKIREQTIQTIMIPFRKVYKVDVNSIVNWDFVQQIINSGYWRVLVYKGNENNVIGILQIKDLLLLDKTQNKKLNEYSQVKLKIPLITKPSKTLLDIVPQLNKSNCKMALITESSQNLMYCMQIKQEFQGEILGIVTFKDITQFIMKTSLNDEEGLELSVNISNLSFFDQASLPEKKDKKSKDSFQALNTQTKE